MLEERQVQTLNDITGSWPSALMASHASRGSLSVLVCVGDTVGPSVPGLNRESINL